MNLLEMGRCHSDIPKAIFKSLCTFPTSIVWISIISPVIDLTVTLILYFDEVKFNFLTYPTEEDILYTNKARKSAQFFSVLQCLCLIEVFYTVRRFYLKATRSAAPLAKIRFSKYTNLIKYPMFLIIFTYAIKPFFVLPKYFFMYHLFNITYSISYIWFFFCFNKMYVIKEGEIYPIAFFLDIIIYISFFIFAVVEIYGYLGFLGIPMHCVYAYSHLIFRSSVLLKQVCVSVDVLENRFLRLPDEIL